MCKVHEALLGCIVQYSPIVAPALDLTIVNEHTCLCSSTVHSHNSVVKGNITNFLWYLVIADMLQIYVMTQLAHSIVTPASQRPIFSKSTGVECSSMYRLDGHRSDANHFGIFRVHVETNIILMPVA